MASLQKNIASQNFTFCLVAASNGSALVGATASGFITKDAGAQAAMAGSFTGQGNGQYNYAPTQGETNAADVGFLITATGAIPVNIDFHTDQVDANGLLKVDTEDWKGTAVGSPATGGIPDVNAKNINNVATTSVTTINANIGTTQPVNFTGTAGAALVKVDVTDIATAAVSTTTAQLGVNVVNINAVSAASVTTVNANQGTTQPVNFTGTAASALVKGDAIDINSVAASSVTTINANVGTTQPINFTGTAGSALVKSDVIDFNSSAAGSLPTNFSSLSITAAGLVATTSNIKKNVASAGFSFLMTDATTHAAKTGLTVTSVVSIDGGAFSATANSVVEVANGTYKLDLAAADVNGNHIMLAFTATGADQLNVEIITQP